MRNPDPCYQTPEEYPVTPADRTNFLLMADTADRLAADAERDPGMYPDPAEGFRWAAEKIRDAVEESESADEQTHYETHTWNSGEDDDECIVCGTTWGECEDACPATDTHQQPEAADRESPPLLSSAPALLLCPPAGRPGGVKSLPLTFWWGRCPNDRCTRLRHEIGWVESSLLGWSVGVAWR